MGRFISFILTLGLLMGCASRSQQAQQLTPQPRTERTKHVFSVGMTRNEVRADLADSHLLASASRPASGWSRQVSPPAGGQAAMFEGSHAGATVEACDVYWIGHTNAPSMYYGKRLNYFYFDRDDKLIGFDWWVID
jgi:hypothetical protein